MRRNHARFFKGLLLAVLLGRAEAAAPLPALPALGLNLAQATVSGVSSGGYMAVQLHLAAAQRFGQGVAVLAGGPYGCAQGSVLRALGPCLGRGEIELPPLLDAARAAAQDGRNDPLSALQDSRVFLFAGARDSVVSPRTTQALAGFYQALLPRAALRVVTDVPVQHAMVTDTEGAACDSLAPPNINACGFDFAGQALQHLLGPATLQPRTRAEPAHLRPFDQRPWAAGAALGEQGWVYVPAACQTAGAACRVHVVLHGCLQNTDRVGAAFAQGAGYNAWAEANRLVVLYPQTGAGAVNACWDWWGYTGAQHAVRAAPQVQAILAMLDQLARPPGTPAAKARP